MAQDRVAFVTGGGSGIGAAAARELARQGVAVVVAGRTPDELDDVVERIRGDGGRALAATADISDEQSLVDAYRIGLEEFGRLDVIVANAGVNGRWAGIDDLTSDDFRSTLDINLTGTFLTVKHGVPHLRRDGGSIVVVSSVNGTRIFSNSGATAYSCSKAGQVALAKMLAVELGPSRIRVNVVCPGAIETNIGDNTQAENDEVRIPVESPRGNIPLTGTTPGATDQVAALIAFLASDASSHISGSEVWIDGAESLLQG